LVHLLPATQLEHCEAAVSGVVVLYFPSTHAVHAEAVLDAADQRPSGQIVCVAGVAQ
jgi:hypothetical protein